MHSFKSKLICAFCGLSIWAARLNAQEPSLDVLQGFKIEKMVRFSSLAEAELKREQLIRANWPNGLPSSRPSISQLEKPGEELSSINPDLISKVFVNDVDVGSWGWHAKVLVIVPPDTNKHLAIVHGGHMREAVANWLDSGLSATVNQLLKDKLTVAISQMPLVAWNLDSDCIMDGKQFSILSRGSKGHDEMFLKMEPELKCGIMRFFLEPLVQTINEHLADSSNHPNIVMVGLSGGGWTTHLYSAIDKRVTRSIPIAGALPLYARPFSRGSKGDSEQYYPRLFAEEDTDGDNIPDRACGVASWLEVFALAAIGRNGAESRSQIQVLNLYDSCCFSGEVYKTYSHALQKIVQQIDGGSFEVFIDDTHRGHQISDNVISKLIAEK